MKRTAVNPVLWSQKLGFHQRELVTGSTRTLYCAVQTSVSAEGEPLHVGDMGAQIACCFDNLEAQLAAVDLSLAQMVRLNVYTTDADLLFQHHGQLARRLAAVGAAPPMTLLGVARLALPPLMVELEATAFA